MRKNLMRIQMIRDLAVLRGIWLSAAFLCLGLMTACSEVRNEIVSNKQTTSESKSKKFGPIDGATTADRSLWNLSYKQN